MATSNRKKSDSSHRPRPLHTSKSFSRIEPSSPKASTRPQRASTIQDGSSVEHQMSTKSSPVREEESSRSQRSAFENRSEEDDEQSSDDEETGKLPADFDELPIELISLADSFIDSLSAKVHPTPPTVDRLSNLFQDFYAVAATHINTHISTLASRLHRRPSPAPSVSSLSSAASKLRAKASSISNTERPKFQPERKDSDQQMLTQEEIADRKRARRVLEQKRLALEEAVERRVCEGIYDRIWRHRSTQDEAQDEKLRSKTAALSVVGIGLVDLGVDIGVEALNSTEIHEEKENEVRKWLQGARDELIAMNEQRYPLGKLQHLKAANKSIVDTLSHFHPSSSADEIMPMMIYTLITSRPEGMNVISNLYFIQRFRNDGKIDGEAAYCITTLEAAITFLETVDLASLRSDEKQSGPAKLGSRPNTPQLEKSEAMTLGMTPASGISEAQVSSASASPVISKAPNVQGVLRPSVQPHNRRISDMFQPPAALGAAGDAVLNSADQGFKTIGNSLGESYKFLIGKLKERDTTSQSPELLVPKTLADARKLIRTPPPEEDDSGSAVNSLHNPEVGRKRSESDAKLDDKVLSLIGGKSIARDRSTDSIRSASSTRKVAFLEGDGTEKTSSPLHTPTMPGTPANVVESMRNLGNTLNPINRIAGMGMMRGFGRPSQPTPPTPPNKIVPDGGVTDLTTAFPDLAPILPPKEVAKVAPPIRRFMEVQNPGELRINEVLELLRDYRRLAGALKDLGAV